MNRIDFRKSIAEGSEPLDEQLTAALEGRESRPAEDPFSMPHPREEMTYERFRSWSHTRGQNLLKGIYAALAVLICIGLSAVLIYTALDLPQFGGADALIDNEVSRFYVEDGLEHTGAVNIISGIILDFRGFDTLGESHVLFIAACTVLMLLHLPKGDSPAAMRERMEAEADDRHFEPRHDPILQLCARILVPLLLVFGIYVLLNGHLSPGGGFSGGAILGAGMILFLCSFGFKKSERFFTIKTFRVITTAALVCYALGKGFVFFTGANGIENGIHAGVYGRILSGGLMLPLNIVVGLVVACTMYGLFTLFRKGDM
jgi:multicomponent Na+:H+ antiporter subunit B